MSRSVHTPERLSGENLEQYLQRREFSRNMVRAATTGWYGAGKTTSRQQQRDQLRRNGKLRGTFGVGLQRAWAKKRREAMPKVGGHPRDAHGAVTLIGQQYELVGVKPTSREYVLAGGKTVGGESFYLVQRIWLGGISAQRGF